MFSKFAFKNLKFYGKYICLLMIILCFSLFVFSLSSTNRYTIEYLNFKSFFAKNEGLKMAHIDDNYFICQNTENPNKFSIYLNDSLQKFVREYQLNRESFVVEYVICNQVLYILSSNETTQEYEYVFELHRIDLDTLETAIVFNKTLEYRHMPVFIKLNSNVYLVYGENNNLVFANLDSNKKNILELTFNDILYDNIATKEISSNGYEVFLFLENSGQAYFSIANETRITEISPMKDVKYLNSALLKNSILLNLQVTEANALKNLLILANDNTSKILLENANFYTLVANQKGSCILLNYLNSIEFWYLDNNFKLTKIDLLPSANPDEFLISISEKGHYNVYNNKEKIVYTIIDTIACDS